MFFESPQFGEHFCPKNSSQHQTSTACIRTCRRNRATPPLPRSPVRFLTSTPKPRAEGSSPSAPAKNREASTMLASLFFVSAHKDSATRHGCALRSACRGASACQWHASYEPTEAVAETSPSAPATKPAKTQCFRRFSFYLCCMVLGFVLVRTPGFLIWFYPFSTVSIPSSTQNAPGSAFFRLFRVHFCVFRPFGRAKFWGPFLCILSHSVYRLKSLVIPVRREVSFLT